MNIHEYQAKSLLKKFGVAVPRGSVAYTAQEARRAADDTATAGADKGDAGLISRGPAAMYGAG